MRTIRLHLLGVLMALIGVVTSMPQPPARHHGHVLRNPAQVQLDDDDDDRDDEAAILEEEEAGGGGATTSDRRRRA